MIRSKNIFLPVSPSPPNHITPQGFLAKFCPIFALSAISCRVNTTVVEDFLLYLGYTLEVFR